MSLGGHQIVKERREALLNGIKELYLSKVERIKKVIEERRNDTLLPLFRLFAMFDSFAKTVKSLLTK